MSRLSVLSGLKSGTSIPLLLESMVLGRMPNCDIVLPDHTVSRQHARIVRRNQSFYLEDLQSRNGTYVNGQRITSATRLRDRDRIQLYDISLTYREDSERLTAVSQQGRVTPEPWAMSDLDRMLEGAPSAETIAEMDVMAVEDDLRAQNDAEVRLQLILEITRCLESPFNRDLMLSRLLQRLALIFPQCDRGYILLTDETGEKLTPVAIRQRESSEMDPMTIRPVIQSVAKQVLKEGKAILSVDRIRSDERDSVFDHEHRSIMCAPLIGSARKSFGIIYVDSSDREQRFTTEDLNVLTAVAILTGQALEQESQHSAKYRSVVDTAADGIMTVNEEGYVESVNLAVEKLFGWDREELVGRAASELIPGGLSGAGKANGNNGAPVENVREVVALKKDGTRFPIHLSVGRFELGGRTYFTGILHDISQRKQAEMRLKQSQQELRDFVENAVEGLHWLSPEGRILWANRAELELLGYQSDEYIGRAFDIFHADSAAARELWERLRRGEELRNYPARLRCKNGEVRDVLISSTIYRRDNRIAQHRCFTRDITEKKKAEESLKRLNETLEQQVRDRTQSVKLLQDVAVIANEAETLGQALQAALNRICEHTQWELGHAYLADPYESHTFVDSGIWSQSADDAFGTLKEQCSTARYRAGEGLIGTVLLTRKPHWIENPDVGQGLPQHPDRGLKFALAFPVLLGEQIVAVMEFFTHKAIVPEESLLQLMGNVGTQLSRVVERRRLQEELIDAVWEQQRYFGQELHDTLGQELTGIGMMVNSLARKCESDKSPAATALREIAAMIQEAKTGVRRLAKGLFPVEVDAEGLRAALSDLARSTRERCNVGCEFAYSGKGGLTDNSAATHVFRIAQEAVNNAVKHSRADRIDITLESDDTAVELLISDNGRGIDLQGNDQFTGMGLRIMRYRANLIGAAFQIERSPSGGTLVSCRVEHGRTSLNGTGDHGND